MAPLTLILAGLALVNLIAFAAFARDKRKAIKAARRISERRLLFWAAIGGWPGAKLAQRWLRHKTYKQPFGRQLNTIGLVHAMLLLAMALGISLLAPAVPVPPRVAAAVPAPSAVVPQVAPAPPTPTAVAPTPREVVVVPVAPPAGGPPQVSLRPPVARP